MSERRRNASLMHAHNGSIAKGRARMGWCPLRPPGPRPRLLSNWPCKRPPGLVALAHQKLISMLIKSFSVLVAALRSDATPTTAGHRVPQRQTHTKKGIESRQKEREREREREGKNGTRIKRRGSGQWSMANVVENDSRHNNHSRPLMGHRSFRISSVPLYPPHQSIWIMY